MTENIPETATLSPPENDTPIAYLIPDSNRDTKIPLNAETSKNKNSKCLILGRQVSSCDIQLRHSSISRKHALLYYDKLHQNSSSEYTLYLMDLGKKGRVFLNQERISGGEPVRVKDGDRLAFGSTPGLEGLVFHIEMKDGFEKEKVEDEKGIDENLTGRERREAEIAAMVSSFETAPTWSKYEADPSDSEIVGKKNSDSKLASDKQNLSSSEKAIEVATVRELPVSHMAQLNACRLIEDMDSNVSSRGVVLSALSIDPSGARVIAGTSNGKVVFWDFGGMDSGHRSFRTIDVDGEVGHQSPLVALSHSTSGDRFIAATASAQPRIFDRDGNFLIEFDKGDVYVVDMARTSGHTASVTGAQWHPLERHIVITSSIDGSVRTWDLEQRKLHFGKLRCDKVYRCKNEKGQRTQTSTVTYHPNGRSFACGTLCGSIQLWSCERLSNRPEKSVYNAHDGNKILSLTFSIDGKYLASRAEDDKVKVWRVNGKCNGISCFATYNNVPSNHETSNVAFSPDGNVLCIGTSKMQDSKSGGMVKFYDLLESGNSEPFLQFGVGDNDSVVRLSWHFKLNQLFCTLSSGRMLVYYDPNMSFKGALLSTSKIERKKNALEVLLESRALPNWKQVITPHALPIFQTQTEGATKRQRERDLKDPIKTKRPIPPSHSKIETGGQNSSSYNFTQFVVKMQGDKNRNVAGVDPREALFKYNEGKQYDDQSSKVLAEKTVEQEMEEQENPKDS